MPFSRVNLLKSTTIVSIRKIGDSSMVATFVVEQVEHRIFVDFVLILLTLTTYLHQYFTLTSWVKQCLLFPVIILTLLGQNGVPLQPTSSLW
jgi:hypothetical protein